MLSNATRGSQQRGDNSGDVGWWADGRRSIPWIRRYVALGGAASVLLACGPERTVEPSGQPPSDEGAACREDADCDVLGVCDDGRCRPGDWDDDPSRAAPIGLGEARSGVIYPEGDRDHWVLDLPAPTWVEIRTSADTRFDGLDTWVQILTPDGGVYAEADGAVIEPVEGTDSLLHAWLDRPGRWLISVQDIVSRLPDPSWGKPSGRRDYEYDLHVTELAEVSEEPAVISADSGVLVVPVMLATGSVTASVELEPLDAASALEIWTRWPLEGSSASPLVEVFGGDGQLRLSKQRLGEEGFASWFVAEPGVWELELSDPVGGASAWQVLYVRQHQVGTSHPLGIFSGTEWVDEVEPSDTAVHALWLEPQAVITDSLPAYAAYMAQGVLAGPDDEDWLELQVRAGDQISVRCFGADFGSTADLRVDLFGNGKLLTPREQGRDVLDNDFYIADVEVAGIGPYFVRVADEGVATGLSAYWRCRVLAAEFDWL